MNIDDLPLTPPPPEPTREFFSDPTALACAWITYVATCTNPTDEMHRQCIAALEATDSRRLVDHLVGVTGVMHRQRLHCTHEATVVDFNGKPLDLSGQPAGLVAATRAVVAAANGEPTDPIIDPAWIDRDDQIDVATQAITMFRDAARDRYPWWSAEC